MWHSQSCVLGWSVLGIWPPGADGSDINSAHRNGKKKFLATGDDFGQVKIFNYPCAKVRKSKKLRFRFSLLHCTFLIC